MMRIVLICLLVVMLCFPVKRLIADSRVVITSDPSGASVTLDGTPIGQTPLREISLPPGAYRLEFQQEGYQPKSYSLEIQDGDKAYPVHVKLDPLTGSLHVKSQPEGAMVYLDGIRQRRTPVQILDIRAGSHNLRLEKEGFRRTTQNITVEADKTASIRLILPPLTGTLTIRTKPNGTEAMLDGKSIGNTPVTRQVAVGRYRLRLSKPKFQPIEQNITIVNGKVTTIVETLNPKSPLPTTRAPDAEKTQVTQPKTPAQGTLVVNSTPPGAMVYLDQTLVGPTPQNKPVDPGSHVIRIVSSGYKDYIKTFSLSPGERSVIQANLIKPSAGDMLRTWWRRSSNMLLTRWRRSSNQMVFLFGAIGVVILILMVIFVVLLRRRMRRQPRTAPVNTRNITPSQAGGAIFGEYQLLEEIGRGGMGVVYLAQYLRHPGLVALKIPFNNLRQDDEFVQRFLRQAEIGAQLSHPHIVNVLEGGEVEGTPYLAMEYIKGSDLRKRLDERRVLPITQAIKYVVQICEALDYVHLKQIYHRDVKPENILLTEEDQVKIMDFGIALAKQMPKISVDGIRWLSGGYLCPDREVGPTSDLYSLGVVFYEMLTGHLPFASEDLVELIRLHENEPLPSLRQQRENIPEGLEEIVLRMLAKPPEERYPQAVAVIQALRPYVMREM